jgi:hypothetical protein
MRISRLVISICGLLLTAAATANAQMSSMPPRQGGEWETTMSGMGREGGVFTTTTCVDPAAERSFSPGSMGRGGPGGAARQCVKEDAHSIPGGYAFESECPSFRGGMHKASGTVTGDFRTQLHMEMDVTTDRGTRHMVMDQRRLSPTCAAGGGGNTITLPDGRVITITPH